MKVTIGRATHAYEYTTWFGLGSKQTRTSPPVVRVTINFSEEEKEIIKRAPLDDFMVYEHPADEVIYEDTKESDRIRRSKMGVAGAIFDELTSPENPRYRYSRFVKHFLEQPTHDIRPYTEGEMALANIENTVEQNLRQLKQMIETLSSRHPTTKREIDL